MMGHPQKRMLWSRKRSSWMLNTVRPSHGAIRWWRAILLLASGAFVIACSRSPGPIIAPDGRPCILAILAAESVLLVQPVAPTARDGDVIMTSWCVREHSEALLNEIERLVR